jgi:hypothetical protein
MDILGILAALGTEPVVIASGVATLGVLIFGRWRGA